MKHGVHHKQGGRSDQHVLDENRKKKILASAEESKALAKKIDSGIPNPHEKGLKLK